MDGRDFLAGDVFEWLPRLRKKEQTFELVVLDPPSFATSKRQVFAARVGTDGTLIHTTGFQVSGEAGRADPSIAWSGESFLIAYEGAAGVVAALLTPGGNILAPDIPLPASGGFDAHFTHPGQ